MRLPCPFHARLLKVLPVATARSIVQKQVDAPSIAVAPAANMAPRRPRLFVDVSIFSTHDAGTGIQRVVREVLGEIFQSPTDAFAVVPIAASKSNGYRTATIPLATSAKMDLSAGQSVTPVEGDVFLGLDLAAQLLPHLWPELLRWKRAGVSMQIVVYDLLPALNPGWFSPKGVRNFHAWLKTIAVFADQFHCISSTVKAELMTFFQTRYSILLDDRKVDVFPLGSNLAASRFAGENTTANKKSNQEALAFVREKPTSLMVGTIEPRKGHDDVLTVFAELWQKGLVNQLVVVGTPGWNTETVQQALTNAATTTQKLLWLQNADDDFLAQLYQAANGVIVASKGEGFGLPLIEAAHYGKPVLARDIPVFREVARGNVTFFPERPETGLTSQALALWLASCSSTASVIPTSPTPRLPDWATSTAVLLGNTGLIKAL